MKNFGYSSAIKVLSFALLLSSVIPATVDATIIYTYTGNRFPSSSYDSTLGTSIDATVILSSLPSNGSGAVGSLITSFTLTSVGSSPPITLSSTNPAGQNLLFTNGRITNWFLGLTVGDNTIITANGKFLRFDESKIGSHENYALTPGTWSTSTVPEPSTLYLFILGLLGLGVLARLRKTKRGW